MSEISENARHYVDQQSKTKDYKQANIHMKFPQRLIFVAVFAF